MTTPRVVIVGAGFGGLSVAKGLARAKVDITVIDRCNYHLFQPLLYQVATAGLSPADIAWPIRSILRGQTNARVLLGTVQGVDRTRRVVLLDTMEVEYDYLVLATGVRHAYFGNDHWEAVAPGLKQIEDATEIRQRILTAFERAEMETDPALRRQLLTFVLVGGGPTGVELAGAIIELSRKALASDFRHIDPTSSRVILIEAGPRILSSFSESLSDFARRSLERMGVDLRLGQPVTECDEEGVIVGGERINAATVLWAAGVAASPAAQWLQAPADRAGRVQVEKDLSIPGDRRIFAIGDTVAVMDSDDQPLPGIAPVAKQQGQYVAGVIAAAVNKSKKPGPFHYSSRGSLATIGRRSAIIEYRRVKLSGRLAWWIWGIAHIYFLIGVRSRLSVAIQWGWSYITFQRGARLITGTRS